MTGGTNRLVALAVVPLLLLSGCGGDVGAVQACADYLGVGGIGDYDTDASTAVSEGSDEWKVTVHYAEGGEAGTCLVRLDGDNYETSHYN